MTWGHRLSEADLQQILARGHARRVSVETTADKRPGRKSARGMPLSRHQQQDKYSRRLAYQLREAGLPQPILEYAFDSQLEGGGRAWRIDLAWPARKLAVEVDGAVHRIKSRFEGDLAKRQALQRAGWDLLPVSPQQVRDGSALELIRYALSICPQGRS